MYSNMILIKPYSSYFSLSNPGFDRVSTSEYAAIGIAALLGDLETEIIAVSIRSPEDVVDVTLAFLLNFVTLL